MFSETPRSLQDPSDVDPKAVSLEFTVQIPGTTSLLRESALESGLRSSPALSLTLSGPSCPHLQDGFDNPTPRALL